MTGVRRAIVAASVLAVLAWSAAARGAEPAPTGGRALPRDVARAFDAGDFGRAADLLRAQLRNHPQDPFVAYNLACALAMAAKPAEAADMLIDAVGFGFADLAHAQRDPHLDPIRNEPAYIALMNAWGRVLDARGEADLKGAKEALGPGYTYDQDPALRLNLASALPAEAAASARREIVRTAAWVRDALGIEPVNRGDRPDPWVLVVLPTPADFAQLIGPPGAGVGGHYDKDRRRLIAQDIGPTLRHEFFHVIHWRRMDRAGQRHAWWIMEGLASLLEDVEDDGEGYRLAPSWRTNIARRLEKASRLTPWTRLFAMERDAFMGASARANYAQARSVLMFLHAKGSLRAWYAAYEAGFADDPTGARAIESALGVTLREAETAFRAWLRDLPMAGEINHPGGAGLGVDLAMGSGDGPEVAGIVAASRAKAAGDERLRRRDVITAIDGRATRSLDELHRLLAGHRPGDTVTLTVRRGTRVLEVPVVLVAPDEPPE